MKNRIGLFGILRGTALSVVFLSVGVINLLVSADLEAAPSFDCTKASTNIERAICKSGRLSRQDTKLASLYKNVLNKLPIDVQKEIKEEQRAWLKNRNKSCKVPKGELNKCLLKQYKDRNSELSKLLAFDSSENPSQKDNLKILRITPSGNDVPAGQQVVFQFDRPVVPIGRMERDSKDVPITFSPKLNCEWRWLNTSALACQLRSEDKMKQATRYDVEIGLGITTKDGLRLKEAMTHSFITARPRATYSRFINWLTPGDPLIQISFNQPVTKASVEAAVTMTARRSKDRSPISVAAYPDNMPRSLPYWMQVVTEDKQPMVDDQKTVIDGETARRVWVVEPVKELPLSETIWMDVNPGLVSSEGTEKGIESRTVVSFETYPKFEFTGIRCTLKGKRSATNIMLETMQKSDMGNGCAPLKPVALLFSSPVLKSMVKKHVAFEPSLDGGRKDYDPWENTRDYTRLTYPHRAGRHYQLWLPAFLQANQDYTVTIDHESLADEFGRKLDNKTDFNFFTSHREPKLKLNHNNAVLEKNVDTDIPLYVTNLDSVSTSYQKMGSNKSEKDIQQKIEISEAVDIAYRVPMQVRKLLGDDSGAMYGSLHPSPTPPGYWRDPEYFVQVTPYQVHAKLGHFNSLIWVTDFASGNPIKSAKVTLYKGTYQNLVEIKAQDITSITNADGLAEFPGISELDPDLELFRRYQRQDAPRYFIKVESKGDIALVPLDRSFLVRSSGTYSAMQKKDGHNKAWGTTAQGIYKLGDTVQYKIYVRAQSNKHWITPEKTGYTLTVTDPQRKTVHELKEVVLNDFGAFDGSFSVPELGAVGWYTFVLTAKEKSDANKARITWKPMKVLVSDFTPAPFKVRTELNGEVFKSGDKVVVNSHATLHSGGPFTEAEVRLTARLQIKPFSTNDPTSKGFVFGSSNGKYLNTQQSNLLDIRGKLSDQGEYEDTFSLPETDIYFGSLLVESAVKDERGKFVASATKAEYAGRDRFVGLKNTQWLYNKGKKSKIETLVVDKFGKPMPGANVNVTINRREYKASRVKGPGNAYLTQNIMSWVKESDCNIKTSKAAAACEFTPMHPGSYQFVASVKDTKGREHKTTLHGWVTGRGSVVWDQSNNSTLQIIASQSDYKIGDKARFLIKNPFPGAKALVTIERYGVLDSWIEVLDTSTPVVEVPIKPDYLPGFYFSVVVMSPRVDKPISPKKVDLGKPSYRMGYVATSVSDPYKEISIAVKTNKDIYKPREKVKATIHVESKANSSNEPYEVAIAVVDESVLALNGKGEKYYDPYKGFNRLDSLDVNNYNLISRLLGRQKFEKKGANPGGDGRGTAYSQLRNLFKFVSYWNPSITPDKEGKASIEFEVPDNLTGWRVLAFAVTPNDKMGLGTSNFKVNRPTELRPVMPNQVVEGDTFKAGFNVMNRTDKSRDMSVKINVGGPLSEKSKREFSYTVKVPPYKRQNIWLPLITKGGGQLTFTAQAGDQTDIDAVEHKLMVNKRRSLETAANYGTFTSSSVSESVQIPEGIYSDVGEIRAVLSPSVIGNIDGAFNYLRDYPYLCWEQRLTKAVMASSYIELNEYLKDDVKWPTPNADVQRALKSAANFQAPNGGMAYWVASNSHVSPYLSAYTAMAFHWLRRSGYEIPENVETNLHYYLLTMLRSNTFPSFYSEGMSSSVRAVALAALSESGKVSKHDVLRYKSHVPEMDLFGKAHFLQAAIKTGVSDSVVQKELDVILGHASQSGGKFQFNEPWDDSYKYILATPMRSNCVILSTLLTAQGESSSGKTIGDIPFKLVRSITQSRGQKDYWENTQENVFCTNAIIDYSKQYESDSPVMDVVVKVDDEKVGATKFAKISDPSVTVGRDLRASDVGKPYNIEISKTGNGRLYYSTQISYDLMEDNASRINSGIEIRREYSVERESKLRLLKSPMDIDRGELVKVDLFISVPTARHFVVVHDPIPGGLEPVNKDLATSSIVDTQKGEFKAAESSWWYKFSDWSYFGRYFWSFYHKELRHDSARFFADYLPAGNYHVSYTAQAIAEGNFTVMPVTAEEMYDPDVYGKGLPATLKVGE
ncbi:alpha-2-macroglobulin family protein [Pseudomonadota bacterium]